MNRMGRMSLLTVVLGAAWAAPASAQLVWDPSCYNPYSGTSACFYYGPLDYSKLPGRYSMDRTTTSLMHANCIGPFANAPGCPGSTITGPSCTVDGMEWSNEAQKCVYPAEVVDGGAAPPSTGGEDEIPTGTVPEEEPKDIPKKVEYGINPGDVFDEANNCWRPGSGGATGTGFPLGVAVAGTVRKGWLVIEQDGVNTFAARLLPASKQGVVNYVEALPGTIEARSGQMLRSAAANQVQGVIDRAIAMDVFHAQALAMNSAEGSGFSMLGPASGGAATFLGGAFLAGGITVLTSASMAGAGSDAVRCQ